MATSTIHTNGVSACDEQIDALYSWFPPHPVPAPLPEAPASVNCHILIEGRQIQLTLRDADEHRLLARLRAVLQEYPDLPSSTVRKAPKNSGETSGMDFCHIHAVPMTLNQKNGRILLANSKSLSFSTLIFGKAQERLDWELKFKRWGHR